MEAVGGDVPQIRQTSTYFNDPVPEQTVTRSSWAYAFVLLVLIGIGVWLGVWLPSRRKEGEVNTKPVKGGQTAGTATKTIVHPTTGKKVRQVKHTFYAKPGDLPGQPASAQQFILPAGTQSVTVECVGGGGGGGGGGAGGGGGQSGPTARVENQQVGSNFTNVGTAVYVSGTSSAGAIGGSGGGGASGAYYKEDLKNFPSDTEQTINVYVGKGGLFGSNGVPSNDIPGGNSGGLTDESKGGPAGGNGNTGQDGQQSFVEFGGLHYGIAVGGSGGKGGSGGAGALPPTNNVEGPGIFELYGGARAQGSAGGDGGSGGYQPGQGGAGSFRSAPGIAGFYWFENYKVGGTDYSGQLLSTYAVTPGVSKSNGTSGKAGSKLIANPFSIDPVSAVKPLNGEQDHTVFGPQRRKVAEPDAHLDIGRAESDGVAENSGGAGGKPFPGFPKHGAGGNGGAGGQGGASGHSHLGTDKSDKKGTAGDFGKVGENGQDGIVVVTYFVEVNE